MNNHILPVMDTEGRRNLINLYELASATESKEKIVTITMSSGKIIETATVGFDQLMGDLATLKERI